MGPRSLLDRTMVFVAITTLVATIAIGAPPTSVAATVTPAAAKGHILVRFDPKATQGQRDVARSAVDRTAAVGGQGPESPADFEHVGRSLVPGLELIQTDLSVSTAIDRVRRLPGVTYAEPDYAIHADLTPDDPDLPAQWGLDQPGAADIDAPAAWDTTVGSPSVVVAVIDSGVQLDHPDLAANVWTNPGEIAGNGVDDDDNGYVDDVHGWDFVGDDNDPTDEFGHGTHVAGTIAAVGNNGIGIAGVAYGSRFMPLRVLDATGSGYISDAVRALDYASLNGARISNASWGWTSGFSQTMSDAIAAADGRDHLLIAAAGNEGVDDDATPTYPASYDARNVISVAATTATDELAPFSNYGASSVDVAAPGAGILSTYPGDTYASLDGTSMATPHVSGVAALILSVHPGWTSEQIRDRILSTARPMSGLAGGLVSGGVVSAGRALAATVDRAPVVTITTPADGTSVLPGSTVTFKATAVDPEDGNVASSIAWVSSVMGPIGSGPTLTRSDLTVGTHVIIAIAHDAAGHTPLSAILLRVGPEIRSIDEGADPRSPVIAVAPDGTPVVAWTEEGWGTVVARSHAGTWSHERVSSGANERIPDVAVEPDGTVRVAIQRAWSNPDAFSDGGILMAADDGSGQGSGWGFRRVSEACGDDAAGCGIDVTPSVVADSEGRAHVAWIRTPVSGVPIPGNGPGLWYAVEHADGTWTSELVLASDDGLYDPDLAVAPDGSVHIAVARFDTGNEGVWHLSDETGPWVATRVATLPAGSMTGWPRIQVGAGGRLDVAWSTDDGVFVRSRVAGTWSAAETVSTDRGGDIDFIRDGTTRHLVYGLRDETDTAAGVTYAKSVADGVWTVTAIDSGQDVQPRMAVDGDGHVHLSYTRAWPEHEVRHVTNATGTWVTDVVAPGWIWMQPSFAVDAAGHHHVAVGRYGESPGVWYGTDATGSWTMSRLSQHQPDGPVSLTVAPDGTASIAYGEYFDDLSTPLPDRAVWLKTGKPGSWTTTRITTNTGDAEPSIARDAAGHLHIAFGSEASGVARIAYATNVTGSWVVTYATPGTAGMVDRHPVTAIDAAGKAHIAYERMDPNGGIAPFGSQWIRYATNAGGTWTTTTVASGNSWRFEPSIALDPSGHPRIAYWLDASGGGGASGVFMAAFDGSSWVTTTISDSTYDVGPSLAVDAVGHAHVLYQRSIGYAICNVTPMCPDAPGLRYWSDAPGFGAPQHVTSNVDDAYPALVLGLDGSIFGGFADLDWRLAELRIRGPLPKVSSVTTHLASSGTLTNGKLSLTVSFSGSSASTYQAEQSVNGSGYATAGPRSSSTSRLVEVTPSTSTTRRFRITGYDGLGASGPTAYGTTVRAWAKTEGSGSGLTYSGTWTTAKSSSYYGGAVRYSSSGSARATWTFTGREVSWIAARGTSRGKAKVYIDGVYTATIDLRASSTQLRQIVYRKAFSSSGTHTISIRPAGTGRIDLDAFMALK